LREDDAPAKKENSKDDEKCKVYSRRYVRPKRGATEARCPGRRKGKGPNPKCKEETEYSAERTEAQNHERERGVRLHMNQIKALRKNKPYVRENQWGGRPICKNRGKETGHVQKCRETRGALRGTETGVAHCRSRKKKRGEKRRAILRAGIGLIFAEGSHDYGGTHVGGTEKKRRKQGKTLADLKLARIDRGGRVSKHTLNTN